MPHSIFPATTYDQAVNLAIESANQLFSVVNGANNETVDAVDGPILTVRHALKNIEDIGTSQFNVIFTDQNILTQNYRTYLVDTSLVPITATLPDNATQGQFVMIFDYVGQASTNNITVNTTDSSTINGGSTYTITTDKAFIGFWKDSTEWKAIDTQNADSLTYRSQTVEAALDDRPRLFVSVASMKTAANNGDVTVGDVVETASYYTGWEATANPPKGGNHYELVDAGSAGARPAEDGGSVIHATGGSGGLYLKGLFLTGNYAPEQWGARRDGSTDDTTAIRSCADFGPCTLSLGAYGVDNLQVKSSDIFIGAGATFWQLAANKPAPSDVTFLKYVGSGGANSVVVRASTEAVGTRPTFQTDGSQDTFGWVMKDLIIDGADLAEFSLYGARCGLGTKIDNVFVTGSKKHGAWLGELWTCTLHSLYAIWNGSNGITLGQNTFGWGANSVNAVEFGTIQAFNNDQDKTFNESTAKDSGYGIGWYVGRATVCHNMIAESNFGPGVYMQPTSGPDTIGELYVEGNGVQAVTDARATREYGVIFDSTASSVSQKINQIHKSGADAQFLWNTGTEPGTGPQEGFEIDGIFGGLSILSDWSNYKLGSQVQVTTLRDILGNFPENNEPDSIDTTGRSGGAVTTLYVRTGGAGTQGGLNISNAMATIQEAVQLASIITTVTTIDIVGFAATDVSIDLKRMTRALTIDGDATTAITQSASNAVSLDVINASTAILTLKDIAPERVRLSNSKVKFDNVDPTQTAADSSTTSLVVARQKSDVEMVNSIIDVSLSTAATKRGLEISGNSRVSMEDSSSITGATVGNSILIGTGGGVLLTDTSAAWTTDVNSAISASFMLQNPTGIQLSGVRLVS